MDRIKNNQQILSKVLQDYQVAVNRSKSKIRTELFIDTVKNTYIVITFGWAKERFVHFVAFHFELKSDGKIWLYENRTDELIIEKMIELGVAEDDIILALVEPYEADLSEVIVGV